TPTPSVIIGDVNQDGVVNALDVFAFAQDWQKGNGLIFQSDLTRDGAPFIDHTDLLRLIQQFQAAKGVNTAKARP
ncbi:MAG TPA: dockerin type I domain-containing protein, partial [bacterium]|nr:dockerin type I domain-containing protein [bacterium]